MLNRIFGNASISSIRSRDVLSCDDWLHLFDNLTKEQEETAINVASIVARVLNVHQYQLRPDDSWHDDYKCHSFLATLGGNHVWESVTELLGEYVAKSRGAKPLEDRAIESILWVTLSDTIQDVHNVIKTGRLSPKRETDE